MKQKTKTIILSILVVIAFLFLPLMAYCNEFGHNALTMRLLAVQMAVIFIGFVIHIVVDTEKGKKTGE